MSTNNQFDVIVIGGSYSGLAASMALGRSLRKVLVIDSVSPCNRQTPFSHNFITNDGKTPKEISAQAKQQVLAYDSVTFIEDLAITANKTDTGFTVETSSGKVFFSKKLVLATGIKDIIPDIDGFAQCWGISVLHCPYCHGYEVKNESTGILANGDTAMELATLISNWTKDLTVYTNGLSTLNYEQIEKLKSHKIKIVEKGLKKLEHQNGHLQRIVFNDSSTAPTKALYARVPFEQHCTIPISLNCELTEDGYIKTDSMQKTSVAGVYACGDNTTRIRTVANAVAMGTTAGMMVNREIVFEEF